MLRITVELLPAGGGSPQHLGTALITNDGTGTAEHGNYTVRLSKWGKPSQTWKRGRLCGFARKRLGPWDLLYRGLEATVGSRVGPQKPKQ